MRRGLTSLALAGLAVVVAAAPGSGTELPPTGGAFVDDNGSIYEADINAIAAEGITKGCSPDGTRFCPELPVTRAQMASFLVRGLDLPSGGRSGFTDIAASIHRTDIDALAAAGITKGCDPSHTVYCPERPVTRAQMAAFLTRALGLPLIYPSISLTRFFTGTCSTDGTSCLGAATFPARRTYDVDEGWYYLLPFASDEEETAFLAPTTRFELTLDGEAVALRELAPADEAGARVRVFRLRLSGLAPGTYRLAGRWYWEDQLVQTTVFIVTAAG